MEIQETVDGQVQILRLIGNFDTCDREPFQACVARAVGAGLQALVIDASRLEFIGSSGLSAILDARNQMLRAGGDLALCGLQRFSQGVVHTIGLDRTLNCFATADDALAHFRG